ncbi:hypothetical protein Goshw_012595 [Gossypium schwendimanii]|uniref:Uncharacterized protein n=1 Tax=Gossypium schwendimanii TaxID=34291 RepID=A0A7J9NAM2_GOSSC|nr:hypothetical protein [Gossypium schwendimanii]
MKAKYYPRGEFLSAKLESYPSYTMVFGLNCQKEEDLRIKSISCSHLKAHDVWFTKSNNFRKTPSLAVRRKVIPSNCQFSVFAEYWNFPIAYVDFVSKNSVACFLFVLIFVVPSDIHGDGSRGGASDFAAGFLLGGAIFGTIAYVFAPQIRRSLLNEDEYGFRKAKRLIYYDEGGNNSPIVLAETEPEVEATM